MKQSVRQILSAALALCLLLSSAVAVAPSVAQQTAEIPSAATVTEAVAVAAESATAESIPVAAKTAEAAVAGTGVKDVSDSLAETVRNRSRVQRVIDGVVGPLRHIKFTTDKDELEQMLGKLFVQSVGGLADNLVKSILKIFPEREFPDYEDYVSEHFLPGSPVYQTAPAPGAKWSVGYSSVSIVPDDILERPYFTAGYFNNYLGKNPITGVLDDQCFRAVCVDDGSGNGTAVFISLDGFALTNANVRKLRARLADFIEDNNIISVNITLTHSHYCIDTSGLGVSLLPFVGQNLLAGLKGSSEPLNSTDEVFMEILFSRGAQAVKDAYNSMKPGKLYYRATDISDMIGDKQSPTVFDPNINTLRFVPDDSRANEIWLVNAGVHPTSFPRESTLVSAEFPYAVVKYAKELAGADVAFYQGAINEISKNTSTVPLEDGATTFDMVQAYGKQLVQRVMAPDSETQIEPYLNITHAEIFMNIENPILMAAAKLQIINSACVSTTGRLQDALLVTELGYCEFGSKLAIALVPGELAPEMAFGGAKTAADSWNGTDWLYPSMEDLAGRKLIVFGLTNDEIGYILPDNDFATTLADALGGMLGRDFFGPQNSHYPEMLSLSPHTGSLIMDYYTAMLLDFKTPVVPVG